MRGSRRDKGSRTALTAPGSAPPASIVSASDPPSPLTRRHSHSNSRGRPSESVYPGVLGWRSGAISERTSQASSAKGSPGAINGARSVIRFPHTLLAKPACVAEISTIELSASHIAPNRPRNSSSEPPHPPRRHHEPPVQSHDEGKRRDRGPEQPPCPRGARRRDAARWASAGAGSRSSGPERCPSRQCECRPDDVVPRELAKRLVTRYAEERTFYDLGERVRMASRGSNKVTRQRPSRLVQERAGAIGKGPQKNPTKGTKNPFTQNLKPKESPSSDRSESSS